MGVVEVGASENRPQAVALREHADQIAFRVHHRRTGEGVFEQAVDGGEQVHFRAKGHQVARHVGADLD
ncbi:hypothetical protein D3C86_2150280 [compost metagenome]